MPQQFELEVRLMQGNLRDILLPGELDIAIGKSCVAEIKKNFRDQGSPKWTPFSPNSLGSRRPSGKKITNSSKLLQDTGNLRDSINFKIDRKGLGFDVVVYSTQTTPPYGVYHQFGTKHIPARPFMNMPTNWSDKVTSIYKTMYRKTTPAMKIKRWL